MKVLKKLVIILFAALMMTAVMKTQVKAATSYDDYERGKLKEFLEQASAVTGKKNGEMINPDKYDSEDPETWSGVEWYEGHVVIIGLTNRWQSYYLAGSLDVSGFTKLEELNVNSNMLTSLNVTGASSLRFLSCYGNLLTALDVSNLPNLYELDCCDNQITTLDFTNSTNQLVRVCCKNNQLTSLTFSMAPYMNELNCSINYLTTLDFSKLPNLDTLKCYNNKLTRLDLRELGGLTSLDCYDNQLTEIMAKFRERYYRLSSNGNGYVEMYVSFEAYSIRVLDEYSPIQGDAQEASSDVNFIHWTYADDPRKVYSTNKYIYLDYYAGCDLVANFTGSPTPQKYTVNFDLKGGIRKGGGELTQLVEPGGSAIAPIVYEREGYQLIGWDASLENITSNRTISAIWAPTQQLVLHVVQFDLNGGIHTGGGYLVQHIVDGGWAIEPKTSREGYIFKGWSHKFDEVKSNLTVKALWEENTYTVIFDPAGGTRIGAGELVQKLKPNSAATAPELIREGYTFQGWDKTFDNITEDITVTALWKENPLIAEETFTITYDANGGEGEVPVDEREYTKGEIVTLIDKVKLSLENHEFAGWSLEMNGDPVDYNEFEIYEDMTFYAVWKEIHEEAILPEPNEAPDHALPDTKDLPDTGDSFDPGPFLLISLTVVLMTAAVLLRRRMLRSESQD